MRRGLIAIDSWPAIQWQLLSLMFFSLMILHTTIAGAIDFDTDDDCDIDGVDLIYWVNDSGGNAGDWLPALASQFGLIDPYCDATGIGSPIDGYPDWYERTLMVFTNMVRMAPSGYRDTFMTVYTFPPEGILNEQFPAVAPLYSNHALNQAARHHALDMAFDCGLQHDSCDGTSFSDRIHSFYPTAGYIGENLASTGASSAGMPWRIISMLLCDAPFGGICPDDDEPFMVIGHRMNIMNGSFDEIGAGFALGSNAYWVQDFNGAQLPPQPPVAAASHAMVDAGEITFFLNYYDAAGVAPRELLLVLDDQPHALAPGLGALDAGTYRAVFPVSGGCRPYYFLVTDGADNRYRYPGEGVFYTYGEAGCVLDYVAD